uniref:NADH dehydrogenase subunit 6 n=1 Tax=Acherontia lachesis TaxID=1086102 RepID=UPI0021FA62BB|nr:NADH dehydrogenase subunit 6 [Acherontia lachesis]UXR12385.1 NADH dehydrogenase subunit 6 [Acherontia lachesis]WMQ52923.1 NADH dehydrogenase subunit 6 [Acherontia lachesis]
MMKMTFSMIMIMLSFMMYFLNHPLSMGLMILIQTMLTCLLSGMMIKTYWFSYILFLTFLGGLLVLFIYVSSIASNELFLISNNMKMFIFMFMLLLIFIQFLFMKNLNWMNLNNNSEMDMYANIFWFNNENKINMNKLYNNKSSMLMMMLIIYLFITLIAIVKITNIFYGPLRTFNY